MLSCNNDFWKELDTIEITHSIVHYLYAIDYLYKTNWYARQVDISKNMWITAGSCSISLKKLLKKWLIIEDKNRFVLLTDLWKESVNKANYKREVLLDFFQNKLWISLELSSRQSCKLEHVINDEIIEKILKIKNIDF